MSGRILAIHVASGEGAPMQAIDTAKLLEGAGIEGDRAQNCITLIEAEAELEAGLTLGQARRAISVMGMELNPLVGKRFTVGDVKCEGIELCHPCGYLEKLLERPGLTKSLANRGGIRARVLEPGEVRIGDAISTK
jgi:MOSC domain-containing protein YiiM